MPLTLKEDVTTICDRYQINESNLMRRAIVELVTNLNKTQVRPHGICLSLGILGHTTDITIQKTLFFPKFRVFFGLSIKV